MPGTLMQRAKIAPNYPANCRPEAKNSLSKPNMSPEGILVLFSGPSVRISESVFHCDWPYSAKRRKADRPIVRTLLRHLS